MTSECLDFRVCLLLHACATARRPDLVMLSLAFMFYNRKFVAQNSCNIGEVGLGS